MQDLRYFKDEGRFLESAWDVYKEYFSSRGNFLSQYITIPSNERKNLFLMIVSGYKLLVRDGEYRLIQDWRNLCLDYLDHTYKFISIMSLIEALFADEEHVDFYQWLTMKKRKKQIFPIADAQTLDENAQKYLATRIKIDNHYKPAEVVARKLYIIRSEFVHQGRLILEFNDGQMFSKREGTVMYSTLSIKDLQLLFEHGILHHFHLIPDSRKI